MAKMGRPKRVVDASRIDELASIGMKTTDISVLTGIPETTLTRRFGALFAKRRAEKRTELIQKQWDVALAGDRTMMIWLGKNYAGQTDKADVTSAGEALKVIIERIG